MSELPPDDPFQADDPRAAERERRRREREARRAGRPQDGEGARRSLADRVSGALEGAAERGKEAIGGLRESGGDGAREEPPDIPPRGEPPRQAPAPPPVDDRAPATDDFAPLDDDRAAHAGETGDFAPPVHETGDFAPAAHETGDFVPAAADTGDHAVPPSRELPPRPRAVRSDARRAGGGGQDVYWRRRIAAGGAAIGAVLLLVAVVALAGRGGEEEPVTAVPEPVQTVDVTVPEGLTIDQMADVADEAGLRGNYKRAARQAMGDFNLRRYGAEDAPNLEGFLFPATYEIERRAPAADLVSRQLEAFEQNISQVNMRKAERSNLTVYDVVKIASMIEREVSIDEERRLASAVMHNRLADGEPLGIDATLRYELDKHDGQLLESELQADTPYNTRIRAGLPPTPISNPGLASLEAAADPANRDVRYYVIKPGTCNEHLFTADPAEFEAAVAEYQAALEAEGGSPTEC